MATRQDFAALVPLHLEAFAGTKGVSLGSVYVRSFLRGFLEQRAATILLAEIDAEVVGYVLGAPLDASTITWRLMPAAAFGMAIHPRVLLEREVRGEAAGRVRSALTFRRGSRQGTSGGDRTAPTPLEPPVFSLVGIGVSRAHRGRSVGHHLVDAFESHARRLGFASVELSVFADNEAALALYESHGWSQLESPEQGPLLHYGKVLPAGLGADPPIT